MAKKEVNSFQNAFIGQAKEPTESELTVALGAKKLFWDQLIGELQDTFQLTCEWNSYSIKAGWALRLKRKTRNINYLSPSRNGFIASFALGDKAIAAAQTSKFPKQVLKIIADAKKYAEGTAVRISVSSAEDLNVIKKLVLIKLES